MIVIVFMLGLGIGSLAGGWLSNHPGIRLLLAFGPIADQLDLPNGGLESRDSLLRRYKDARLITDDNMGTEWQSPGER